MYCSSILVRYEGCVQCSFLLFLDFKPSRYVDQVFSKWFWDRSSCPSYYWYHFVVTFHIRCFSVVRSLCFRIFSASFLITFLSPGIAKSVNLRVIFSLSRTYYYYYYYKNWHFPDVVIYFCSVCFMFRFCVCLPFLWCICIFCVGFTSGPCAVKSAPNLNTSWRELNWIELFLWFVKYLHLGL